MTTYKPHITDVKKKEVEDVKRLFNEYPVVAIINLENLPTLQLQRMKKKISGTMVLKHTKKRLMKIAMDELKEKPKVQELKEKLKGVPALLFTKEDPFSLFKILKKNQSNAAAKPGQEAPEDLVFPAGPTSFAPGPMIGELGQLGMQTEIVGGKIHVKADKVLVKEGETVTAKVAELLAKLGIEPMKIGLNVICTYENGEILTKEVLGVDEEEYIANIRLAHSEAFNLAVFAGYATAETVELLVQKAARESLAVAKEGKIQTSETVKEDLAQADAAAKSIEAQLPDMPAEAPKEEPKSEEPKEEKKEEPKEEEKPAEPETPKEEVKEETKPEPVEEPKEEAPVEEKKEEPVEEEKKEESKEEESEESEEKVEEEVEEEGKEEIPVAEPQQEPTPEPEVSKEEPKEEVITNAPEEKLEETVQEEVEKAETSQTTEDSQKTDEQVAQDVLRELTEGKIKKQAQPESQTTKSVPVEDVDMDKLINNLKDKKSKGEI